MKTTSTLNTAAAVALMGVLVFGLTVSADAGRGYDQKQRWENDSAEPRSRGRGGWCLESDLTDEQRRQLADLRQAHISATAALRREIRATRLALRAELAKAEPDGEAARALQEELSGLKARMDQERLEHVLAARKISPAAGGGFLAGHHLGHAGRGMDGWHGRGGGRDGKGRRGSGTGACR